MKRGALLLAASAALLFFDFGRRMLSTNDETRFPLLARDILERGDWLLPRLNGALYLNKPPLYAWLVALASWPRGAVTQSTAALPSLLAALGLVLVTAWIARRLFGAGAGLVAGLVVVTMYGVFSLARAPMPDMTLCLAEAAAIAAFVAAEFERRPGVLAAFYLLVAVAFWTKGPAGLLPIAVVVAYSLATHGRSGWAHVSSVPGILVLVGLVAGWSLLGAMAGRQAFIRGVVETDMIGWYLRAGGLGWRAISEPFAQTATVLLPWTIALPWVLWRLLRDRSAEWAPRGTRLLLFWACLTFVAIALSHQQRMRYYLPLCPPVAALIAGWCATLPLRRRASVFAGAWIVVACALVGWQLAAGARHNRATDLRGLLGQVETAPRPLYAAEIPELVLAFYLGSPVAVLPDGRSLEQYLEDARAGYLVVADRVLTATDGAAPPRPVAAGAVGGRGFAVFAKE